MLNNMGREISQAWTVDAGAGHMLPLKFGSEYNISVRNQLYRYLAA